MRVLGTQTKPEFASPQILERIDSPEHILQNWAKDTWGSIERMIDPETGLPADILMKGQNGAFRRSWNTSLTDMATLVWSSVAALDLDIIGREKAQGIVGKLLRTYGKLEKFNSLPLNWYDRRTGENPKFWQSSGTKLKLPNIPFVSSIDLGWWLYSLVLIQKALPKFTEISQRYIDELNLSPIYDANFNLFHGGILIDGSNYSPSQWYIDVLNHEGRMLVYMAVMLGKIPKNALYALGRDKPSIGKARPDKKSFQEITLSYSGGGLEMFAPPIFIDEKVFLNEQTNGLIQSPNHQAATKHLIEIGNKNCGGRFAWTPCLNPSNVYMEYGCHDLAMGAGYPSSNVEAIHGYYFTFPYAPNESYRALERIHDHPGAFNSGLGFVSSIDDTRQDQSVAPGILTVEQGFIMAQTNNILNKNKMRDYLSIL